MFQIKNFIKWVTIKHHTDKIAVVNYPDKYTVNA